MILDTALLSRMQFGFTISFHILFPAFSIGLAMFLAIMEGIWLKTQNPVYKSICLFWTKVFALTFGMGVVSGIVMEFQLGTNWAGFTKAIGGVLGPLFTWEVMTAFFIEAGFLGVMLFCWDKVSPRMHYFATLLVVGGTTLSAYWILTANTWMQHPVGFHIVDGIYKVDSWYDIIFNRAGFPRYFHMMLAAYITASFVIASVSGFYLLKGKFTEFAKKCFSFAWLALFILIPTQLFVGDATGLEVHNNQPIKTAAIEGVWDTQAGAPLLLFAIPDQKNQKNLFEIGIPYGASLINTHKLNGVLQGLKTVPPADQPKVAVVFFTFRIMVGIGILMLLLACAAMYLRYKNRLYDTRWFQKASIASAPLGFMALWCGWLTAEIGRQPWIVYNHIRTLDAASDVALRDVMISFGLIIIVYGIVFGVFYFYFLTKTIRHGPGELDEKDPHQPFLYMPSKHDEE